MNVNEVQRYAEAVTAVLAGEFPADFDDETTREAVTNLVVLQVQQKVHEVIVDGSLAAKWRLYPDPDNPPRVKLHVHRLHPRPEDVERAERINQRLAEIPIPGHGEWPGGTQ